MSGRWPTECSASSPTERPHHRGHRRSPRAERAGGPRSAHAVADEPSPGAHAILATRRDLPLRLHRLRLAGELAEIRAADLRFSERETRELLEASGIALSEAGVALLHQRTEGWAAGLRLAAISLAGHPDPERFVAEFSGSDRTVAEYLVDEMLERQPDDDQGSAAAHLPARPGERGTGGPADRRPGLGADLAGTRGRERVRGVAGPGSDVVPLPPPVRGSAAAGAAPEAARPRYRRCTGAPPGGSPGTARWPRLSGTRRRRATGRMRPGCSPTIRSA